MFKETSMSEKRRISQKGVRVICFRRLQVKRMRDKMRI